MSGESPSLEQLAPIDDGFVRELAALGRVRIHPKGTIVITEGDTSDSVFVILAGKVRTFVSDIAGHELTLKTQGPGEYVGEMAFNGQPRSASVITMEATVFSVVQREALREAIRRNPDFALDVISRLIERAREATGRAKSLALLDVYGRVARLLLELSEVAPGGKTRVRERLTQQDIADRVGASRDMVSRILRDLAAGGYISMKNREIIINKRPPARW